MSAACSTPVKTPSASSYEVAEKVATALQHYPAVEVRADVVFATGVTLEDALGVLTGVEQAADIIYRVKLLGQPLKRDYSKEKGFTNW